MIRVEVTINVPLHLKSSEWKTYLNVMDTIERSFNCDEEDEDLMLEVFVVNENMDLCFHVPSSKQDKETDDE